MLYETLSQGHEFIAMMASGMVMAAAALIFAGLRRMMVLKFWGALVCDFFMGIVWGVIACAALTAACHGSARAYHFLAMLSGAALFAAAASPAVRQMVTSFNRMVENIAAKMRKSRGVRAIFR